MANLADDVLDYLQEEGLVAGSTGWTRGIFHMPPSPDRMVVVYETPGLEPELAPDGSVETEYDEPGFQVRVRGGKNGAEEARAKMQAIYKALHGSQLAPASGDPAYVLIRSVQSGPAYMGQDSSSRPEFTWNFIAMRERG